MSAAQALDDSAPETIRAAAGDLLRAARDQLRDTVELAAAEARLAAMTGLTMLVLVLLATAFLLVGWGLLMAAVAYLGLQLGLSWPQALLGLVVLHGLAALLALHSAMRMTRQLTLPALRGVLLGGDPGKP